MNKTSRVVGGIVVFIVFAFLLGVLKSSGIQLGGIAYAGIMFFFLFVFSRVTGWGMWRKNKK